MQSVSLPRHSSWFISVCMWGHGVCQPPPCGVCQLQPGLCLSTICHLAGSTSCRLSMSPLHPSGLSPPLLLVWLNVSSLSHWLSDFHTVQFSVSSVWFLFLNCYCPSFGCARRHSVSTCTSILARNPRECFDDYQMGVACGGMGVEVRGLRSTNR